MKPPDPKGAIGATKCPMYRVPSIAIESMAWVFGSSGYDAYNWRESKVCATTYISAMMRHMDRWRDGEDLDRESGLSHLGHIMANCAILMDAMQCRTLFDDRSKLTP